MVVILGKVLAYNLTHNLHIVHFSFKSTRLCISDKVGTCFGRNWSQIDMGSSPGFTANQLQALELNLLAVLSHSKMGLNDF